MSRGGGGLKSLHGLKEGSANSPCWSTRGRGVKKARKLVHMVYEWRPDEMINNVLLEMEKLFQEQNKDLAKFIGEANMPKDIPKVKEEAREILDETDFDMEALENNANQQYSSLNEEQKLFVDAVIEATEKQTLEKGKIHKPCKLV